MRQNHPACFEWSPQDCQQHRSGAGLTEVGQPWGVVISRLTPSETKENWLVLRGAQASGGQVEDDDHEEEKQHAVSCPLMNGSSPARDSCRATIMTATARMTLRFPAKVCRIAGTAPARSGGLVGRRIAARLPALAPRTWCCARVTWAGLPCHSSIHSNLLPWHVVLHKDEMFHTHCPGLRMSSAGLVRLQALLGWRCSQALPLGPAVG